MYPAGLLTVLQLKDSCLAHQGCSRSSDPISSSLGLPGPPWPLQVRLIVDRDGHRYEAMQPKVERGSRCLAWLCLCQDKNNRPGTCEKIRHARGRKWLSLKGFSLRKRIKLDEYSAWYSKNTPTPQEALMEWFFAGCLPSGQRMRTYSS